MAIQQHTSAALSRLKRGVYLCATGLFLAALIQLFVFGFVHFTDVRYQTLENASPAEHRPVVVTQTATGGVRGGLSAQEAGPQPEPEPLSVQAAAETVPDVNRVASTFDVILKRFSQGAVVIGIFSAVGLAVLTLLGSIVAGGASVPGVEKAVSACMWGLGLCLLALPWQDVFNSMPFAGVFTGYTGMVAASEGTSGSFQLMLLFVGIPAAAMAGAMVAALRFGSGVEVAVVAGLKNKPMDAVDTAMAATRANLSSNRQAGAVNNVFLPDGPPSVAPEDDASRTRASEPPARRRSPLSMTNSDEKPDYKRPI